MKTPIESTIISEISHSIGVPENAISADQTMDDLGMTSILAVQLSSKLQQQFGITDMSGISTSNTVGELVDYVQSKAS
ncbi:acyl carrier protein [Chitinophaga varians]|uniref:Acyl carrier protein n=1 Tax=Chitinophaga varians TaxID=2202339 RepID=A0A847RUJ5_9BACT|nr:acyl carrier protein [Chitinophaga varians]NLR69220.1 acyl carrier protein [Chitinophaga varians]